MILWCWNEKKKSIQQDFQVAPPQTHSGKDNQALNKSIQNVVIKGKNQKRP